MNVETLLNSASYKRAPAFINTHTVFQNIKRIDKPFPSMGLKNSIEKCETEFDGKPSYILFSSNNITGFWDLLTMSMRGVCSCMHWENEHSKHLVGSVTDPFLGMIYISDGESTPYGISIRRRSLVRLVHNHHSNMYKILLERVYKDTGNKIPTIYNNRDDKSVETMQVFKDFIAKKTNNKYEIVTSNQLSYADRIPKSDSLSHVPYSCWSMSDCNAAYYRCHDSFATKFANQS